MDSQNSQNSKSSKGNKSKVKQAEDADKYNSLGDQKLILDEEIAQMFGFVFERQVSMLFQSDKDESFHVGKKFLF